MIPVPWSVTFPMIPYFSHDPLLLPWSLTSPMILYFFHDPLFLPRSLISPMIPYFSDGPLFLPWSLLPWSPTSSMTHYLSRWHRSSHDIPSVPREEPSFPGASLPSGQCHGAAELNKTEGGIEKIQHRSQEDYWSNQVQSVLWPQGWTEQLHGGETVTALQTRRYYYINTWCHSLPFGGCIIRTLWHNMYVKLISETCTNS